MVYKLAVREAEKTVSVDGVNTIKKRGECPTRENLLEYVLTIHG